MRPFPSLPTLPRSDDEIVARFRENPHYRIGYMEGALASAREEMERALRLIPVRSSNAMARKYLESRVEVIKRAESLAEKANGQ